MLLLYIFKIQKLHVDIKMSLHESSSRVTFLRDLFFLKPEDLITVALIIFVRFIHHITICYFQIKAHLHGVTMIVFVLVIIEPIHCFASCDVATFSSVNGPLCFLFGKYPNIPQA